jgi:general secretion pathway protein L
VKFVLIDVGFRHTQLMSSFEEVVPGGEAPLSERQGEALQIGLARLPAEAIPYMALPGEMLAVRALDLPFSDARKIEQVVGYELEGQIVHALQDVVFDHVVCKPRGGEGSTVLAAAARVDEVGDLLAGAERARGRAALAVRGPGGLPALFTGEQGARARRAGLPVLIDIGHRRTNVCFLLTARRSTPAPCCAGRGPDRRGGGRPSSAAPTGPSGPSARRGIVGSAGRRPQGPSPSAWTRCCARPCAALARDPPDHRQLPRPGEGRHRGRAADRRDRGADGPGRVPGRGAGPAGVALRPESPGQMADPPPGAPGEGRFTLATAIAWAGARGSKELDLRRGPFQYKASFSVLRQKAAHLGALAAALLVCATVDGSMSLSRLSKEKETLQAQLRTATTELFGEPRMDAKAVSTPCARSSATRWRPSPRPPPSICWARSPSASPQHHPRHHRPRHPAQEDHHPRHHRLGHLGRRHGRPSSS